MEAGQPPGAWTYPLPVPEALILALAPWGRPVTTLTVFFKGLGRAWRQGLDPLASPVFPTGVSPASCPVCCQGGLLEIPIAFHPAGGAL